MKITKTQLKQIIKEEVDALGKEKATVSQIRSRAMAAAKAQGAQGITAQERGLIKQLSDMLVSGAEETNILSGTVVTRIKQLAAELQKLQKAPAQGEQQ
jgi:hypothetical protein